jgi:uncharacterized protein (DUF2236 family)
VTDEGLFGPDSLTWRVHSEPVLWVAGIRALLLQALHPAAVAGVLHHSDFRADPWGRLLRTARFVGTVTYGSSATVQRAGARVRALHRQVSGVDPVTGTGYRADDPELLRWVHCCEVDSFLTVYRRAGGGLSAAEADRYVLEQRRAAAVVGVRPEDVPGSVAELAGYFERMRPYLGADTRSRTLLRYLLVPPMPARVALLTPARPGWAGVILLAFALLPPWARRCYGTPGLPVTDPAASAALRLLAGSLRVVPAGLREGPQLRAARQRLAAAAVDPAAGGQPAAKRANRSTASSSTSSRLQKANRRNGRPAAASS